MPRTANSTAFGMKYCTGVSSAAGRIISPRAAAPRRDLAGRAGRSTGPRTGSDDQQPEAADRRRRTPALERSWCRTAPRGRGCASTGAVKRPNPIAAKAEDHRLERADLPEAGERRLDRDRRGLVVLDAPRRARRASRTGRGAVRGGGTRPRPTTAAGMPEHEERPPPAVGAAGERGDAADDDRAQGTDAVARRSPSTRRSGRGPPIG